MGVEPCANSQLRAGGLLYSQFYSSVKEVFAARNQYPFTNTAIETLALDPQLRKTWQHVRAGLSYCRFTTILHVARPVLFEYGVLVVW